MLERVITNQSQGSDAHHNAVINMQHTPGRRPIVGLGVVVWKQDRVLLIKRGKHPRKNQWSIPGGAQELGETVEQGAIREVKEETGVEIKVLGLIDVVDGIFADNAGEVSDHYTLVDFAAEWVDGEPVASGDASEALWATLDDVNRLIEWEETKRIIHQSKQLLIKS